MPRGGARPNSGPKAKPKVPNVKDKGFAARVLERIGRPGWQVTKLDDVKSAEDYAIWLLSGAQAGSMFDKLIDRRDGLPVRTVNHLHDKPVEHLVTHTISERMRIALEKAEKRASGSH
jgi:hypothetical protein